MGSKQTFGSVNGKDNAISLPANYDRLSPAERKKAREEYIRIQDGKCWFCEEPLTEDPASHVLAKPVHRRLFPEQFFKYPVHLHHSHDTGKTIGAIHAYCNAVLWEYYGQ